MRQNIYFFITHKAGQHEPIEKLKLRHVEGEIDGLLREAHQKGLDIKHFFDQDEANDYLTQYITTKQSEQDKLELDALNDLMSWARENTTTDTITSPKTRGGKRNGAGRKPGSKVPHLPETRQKLSLAMKGNKNAEKTA